MMTSLRPRDVIKESWPSLCVTSVVGLRAFKFCRTKFISYFYIVILLTCYYISYYFSINYSDEIFTRLEIISNSIKIRRIQMILNIFILPIMTISSIIIYDKLNNIYLNIYNLDKILKMFNIKLNYDKCMREEVIHIFGIIIFTILTSLIEYYNLISADINYMYNLFWITIQFPQIINSIVISTFVVIIMKIQRRHAMINNLIIEFKYLKKNEVSTVISTEINNVFKLRLLREMYEICNNVAYTINKAYGVILLISLVIYFIAICAHLNITLSTYKIQYAMVDCIVDSIWALFYFGKFIYITDACHSYEAEGKRASRLLHEYRVDADHHLLKQENELFARQVGNRDIGITACNFFTINYSLLTKVVLALTTYVFFLSQFSCAK